MRIHHIGIVVPKISDSMPEITKYIKFDKTTMPALVASQKVNVCFLELGGLRLELIEPADENSPVSNFAQKGGGYHHLCFEVTDLQKQLDEFVKKGARIIVEPVKGFEDRMIAFVMLNTPHTKVNLIELVESNKT